MTIRIIPLDAVDEFGAERRQELVGWLEVAAPDVARPLEADRIDVVLAPGRRPIPGWNCNGLSHGPARITITVQPDCRGRETRPLAEQLRAVLAHEVHHCMRLRGPGYGRTLGEALVSEGLSQSYEEEVGCPTPNYALAVRGPVLDELRRRAAGELHSTRYDHANWFFGSGGDPAFPWSGGYSLGYVLARSWLATKELSASAAVQVSAEEVLRSAFDNSSDNSNLIRVLS